MKATDRHITCVDCGEGFFAFCTRKRCDKCKRLRENKQRREWKNRNKDVLKERRKEYLLKENNLQKTRDTEKRYREKNRAKIAARKKHDRASGKVLKWKQGFIANHGEDAWKARCVAYTQKRNAIKLSAMTPTTDLNKIKALYQECKAVQQRTGIKHHVDHIIPLSIGGAHHQNNLRIIEQSVNNSKWAHYDPSLGGVWADNDLAKKNRKLFSQNAERV